MFIWTFLITKTYEITSCSYDLKSWNTLYMNTNTVLTETKTQLHNLIQLPSQFGTLMCITLGNTQYSNMPDSHLVFILTYDREDNNASKHGCEAVCERHHDSIPVTVVVDRVVRWEGDKATKSKSQWEENLCTCFQPHDRIRQCPPLNITWQNAHLVFEHNCLLCALYVWMYWRWKPSFFNTDILYRLCKKQRHANFSYKTQR